MNSIEKIKNYGAELLDEVFSANACTAVLEGSSDLLKFVGADTVMIPKISMDGLGDYSRQTGYPDGDVTLEYEPHKLRMDRGRSFQVDAMDDEETAGVAFGKLGSQFLKKKVIPEVDAYRLSTLYANADSANVTNGVTLTAATVLSSLNADEKKLRDNEVEPTECIRFISTEVNQLMQDTDKISKVITQADYEAPNGLNFSVKMLNGIPMIVVPKARFYTAYVFGDNGFAKQEAVAESGTKGQEGYVAPVAAAVEINYLTVHTNAAIAVKKHEQLRVFDPQTNQKANAWKMDYRLYHDIFTPDNKQVGITACTK